MRYYISMALLQHSLRRYPVVLSSLFEDALLRKAFTSRWTITTVVTILDLTASFWAYIRPLDQRVKDCTIASIKIGYIVSF